MAENENVSTPDEAQDISVPSDHGLPAGHVSEMSGQPSARVMGGITSPATNEAVTPTAVPGVYVDSNKVVVLASRLGRGQEPLPKINPDDPTEPIKYCVPEAFERGQTIFLTDIPKIAGMDNVARLKKIGAIGGLDHPDAAPAIAAYEYRTQQEQRVAAERGIVVGEPQTARA